MDTSVDPHTPLEHMLTPEEVADKLGIKTKTLAMWRCYGGGPRFVKFGRSQQARVKYYAADVEAWKAEKTFHVENTAQVP